MSLLIYSHNTTSPGTASVTRAMIAALSQEIQEDYVITIPACLYADSGPNYPNIQLRVIGSDRSRFAGWVSRFASELISLRKLEQAVRPRALIVMANYAPFVSKCPKIVFMRHPHLVESHWAGTNLISRQLNRLRIAVFKLTLRDTSAVILQSEYMLELFRVRYPKFKGKTFILGNPLMIGPPEDSLRNSKLNNSYRYILYASRAHPHKNHNFLIEIVHAYSNELKAINAKFVVTVDGSLSSYSREICERLNDPAIRDLIINIGEIEQSKLAEYYASVDIFFFPSSMETFGNPLVEALSFELPIVAPDLPFIDAICGDSALKYTSSSVSEAFESIRLLLTDKAKYESQRELSRNSARKFLSPTTWVKKLLEIVDIVSNKTR